MNTPDPIIRALADIFLPPLTYRQTYLGLVVESLRVIAGRALERQASPVVGGVSLALLVQPQSAQARVDFVVRGGTSIADALCNLAAQTGLEVYVGPLGAVLTYADPQEVLALLTGAETLGLAGAGATPGTDDQEVVTLAERQAIARYPRIAVQGPAQRALLEAARTWPEAQGGELSALEVADLVFNGIPGLEGTHNLHTEVLPLAPAPTARPPKGKESH